MGCDVSAGVIREHFRLLRQGLRAADGVAVAAGFAAAYHARALLSPDYLPEPRAFARYLPLLLVVVPLWAVLLQRFGGYESLRRARIGEMLWLLARVQLLGLLLFAWFLFFAGLQFVSRAFVVGFGVLGFAALALERGALMLFVRALRRRGYNYRNILVVGTSPRAREFAERLEAHREWGFRVIGYLDEDPRLAGRLIGGHRVLGGIGDLARVADERVIDEVAFVVPRSWLPRLDGAFRALDELGIRATLALDLFDLPLSRFRLGDVSGVPTLTYASTPLPCQQLVVKRLCDTAAAAVLLALTAPAFALIAAAVRLTSPGPVFFRQERIGLHGRRFTMLKFRSMVDGAEGRQGELLALNEMTGPVFKMRDDPRVTRVGRWLRRTSLDELPQLVNVLRGEMSLVGPRPPLPHEIARYARWQRRRLSMRPGLTCLWQVSGRNRVDFEAWMRLDLAYIDNWSLGLDLKILARTLPAVLSGAGAS